MFDGQGMPGGVGRCSSTCRACLFLLALFGFTGMGWAVAADSDQGCLVCHGNAGLLMRTVKSPDALPDDGCAAAPSRPPFLNVFVNAGFSDSLHGRLGCVGCHGGDASASDHGAAHVGLKPADVGCRGCHQGIAERHDTSVHHTLSGMAHALQLRSGEDTLARLDPVWENDCATCHTSCADCHVALPQAVGGGLIKGHEFLRRAPMEDSCALCHGSRAGGEYLGHFAGVEPDIHFEKGMHCLDCHRNDLHGDGSTYTTRWDVDGRALCTDCHAELPNDAIAAHGEAHTDVACQVCHAQPYQNCFGCHAGENDDGYFREVTDKSLLIKIGKNTAAGYPYDIVTLRNNPVARDSFAHFGEDLLPRFDVRPTWKTMAPHTIRRVTAQNRSCDACHGDTGLWLGANDLDPTGAAANLEVIQGHDSAQR